MRRIDHRLWAFWFLALLLAPAVLALAERHPNDTYIDLARPPGPGFDASRLLDEDYYREVDAFAADRLAVRGAGLWAKAMIDYEVFGDSGTSLVEPGDDGWLYWTPYLEVSCEELAELSLPDTSLSSAQLRVAITAPKAAFHPGPLGSIRPCEVEARAAWRTTMEHDPRHVGVNRRLDELRERRPAADLFYRGDTHWSPIARRTAARTFVNAFSPGLWDDDALVPTEGTPFVERLFVNIGFARTATLPDWEVDRGVQPTVVTDAPFGLTGLHGIYETTMDGDAPVIDGTTLIIGDSQMDYLLPYIAPYFERMLFVQAGALELGYDVSQHRADRVLLQTVEAAADRRLSPQLIGRIEIVVGAE